MAGYIEPLEDPEPGEKVRFENRMIGNAIPPGYITAVEKGFLDACNAGAQIGHPVEVSIHISGPSHPHKAAIDPVRLKTLRSLRQSICLTVYRVCNKACKDPQAQLSAITCWAGERHRSTQPP